MATRKQKRQDTQKIWRKDRRKAWRKLNGQRKWANTRAKYGPRMKPAPVTIIRPGEDAITVDQRDIPRA